MDTTLNARPIARTNGLEIGLSWLIALLIPPLLIMIGVRLAMTPAFVMIEYGRADFPPDFYGFTQDERREYAPYAINYLLNGEGIEYLGDLTFPDGEPLYNLRELRHMVDVKVVTEWAYRLAILAGIVWLVSIVVMRRNPFQLRMAIRRGAWLTIGLIALVVVGAIFAWEIFFTAFHQLFFEGGSWIFLTSDTLIRLFPERFWFDAALFIGGFTLVSAILLLIVTRKTRVPS